jgi:hypothetical protein
VFATAASLDRRRHGSFVFVFVRVLVVLRSLLLRAVSMLVELDEVV